MTAKEKAIELIDKMNKYTHWTDTAKMCAIIAVDEILKEKSLGLLLIEWWSDVKKEIEKL